MLSIFHRTWPRAWGWAAILAIKDILFVLYELGIGSVWTHEAPIFWHDHWCFVGVLERCIETVVMIQGRPSLEAHLFFIAGRVIAALTRSRSHRRWIRCGHLIFVDLWRSLVKGNTLCVTVEAASFCQFALARRVLVIRPYPIFRIEAHISCIQSILFGKRRFCR